MRCTCGFNRFAEHSATTSVEVERYRALNPPGGFGATPCGTSFGGDNQLTGWGLYNVVRRETGLSTRCRSCLRPRHHRVLVGGSVLTHWVEDAVYIEVSDYLDPGCLEVRFVGPATYTEVLYSTEKVPPIELFDQSETVSTLPVDAVVADTTLRASFPQVATPGNYRVEVVDRCAKAVTVLTTLYLEA